MWLYRVFSKWIREEHGMHAGDISSWLASHTTIDGTALHERVWKSTVKKAISILHIQLEKNNDNLPINGSPL